MSKRKIKVIERKLGREKCQGQAWLEEDKIEIDSRLGAKAKFSVAIHEILHLCNDDFSEKDVLKFEKLLIDTLWKLGYRKVDLE